MSLRLITGPASYPVTLAEAKLHCRVDGSDEDTLLNGLIAAATGYVEQYTGLALLPQTWELLLDQFSDTIQIPKAPTTAITSVKYIDTLGAEQTVSNTEYVLDAASEPQWLVKASDYEWPEVADGVNNVIIRFVCGFQTVPPAIKQAILLLIGDYYRSRENTTIGVGITQTPELPHGVNALLANYRQFGF